MSRFAIAAWLLTVAAVLGRVAGEWRGRHSQACARIGLRRGRVQPAGRDRRQDPAPWAADAASDPQPAVAVEAAIGHSGRRGRERDRGDGGPAAARQLVAGPDDRAGSGDRLRCALLRQSKPRRAERSRPRSKCFLCRCGSGESDVTRRWSHRPSCTRWPEAYGRRARPANALERSGFPAATWPA